MFTVTHPDAAGLEPSAPSAAYLWWIATGLGEAHGWNADQIAAYLGQARGISGAWTQEELAAIARSGPAQTVDDR